MTGSEGVGIGDLVPLEVPWDDFSFFLNSLLLIDSNVYLTPQKRFKIRITPLISVKIEIVPGFL